MIKQIVIGIIILVVGYLIYNQLTKERIEVVYSISERITADFTSEEIESIQQISIRNTGDIIANDIVLKIEGDVSDYQLRPFRHTDTYSVDSSTSVFEIIYSELPPKAEIILNIKSLGDGINYDHLAVSHSLGEAVNIFQGQADANSYLGISILIFWFSLALIPIILIYLDNKYSLKKEASDFPDRFLKKKKPFFVSRKFWNEARLIAIQLYFKKEITLQPESEYYLTRDSSYKLLNSDVPGYLSTDEWNTISEIAENIFLTRVKLIAASKFDNWGIVYSTDILNVKKPKHMSEKKWGNAVSIISESYVALHLIKLFRDSFGSSFKEKLTSEKPSIVIEEVWDRYKELVFKYIYLRIILSKFGNDFRYDELVDLKVYLPDDMIKNLEAIIDQHDKLNDRKEYYDKLIRNVRLSLLRKNIESDLSKFEEEDIGVLNEFSKEVLDLYKEAINNKEEAHNLMSEYKPLKEKVKKQLSIIDDILKDPNEIDKVEEYDIPFSEGNWNNLKMLANHLKTQ